MTEEFRIGSLFIYPFKSLGGIQLSKAEAGIKGFKHDRRWMIVDPSGRYLSQKEIPAMALLKPSLENDGIVINAPVLNRDSIYIPFNMPALPPVTVKIFNDELLALPAGKEADSWFSEALEADCRLVFMPEDSKRKVSDETVSFANSFPYLVISGESAADLNSRLSKKIPIDRFRANIVLEGGEAWEEDTIDEFSTGDAIFKCAKPCARCKIINIDQNTIEIDNEPLSVLSAFRQQDDGINFGYRSLCLKEGVVKVGDRVNVVSRKKLVTRN